ncbi:MAG: response regulator transcription factor [Clostridia bacterium]|nr:response regulator transcription factor [Clostridia bacterium]
MRIALVDDNGEFREGMRSFAKRYEKETGRSVEIDCFCDGMDFLEKYYNGYDLVFLDIEMPYLNGIEVAKKLREKDEIVTLIFMTNMPQYAINGYEVNAIDYVIKPVSYFTFKAKTDKAVRYREKNTDYDFTVSNRDGIERLQTSSVYYVEVMNHSLLFHTAKGVIEASGSLNKIEETLAGHSFFRCNACYLVNLRFVEGFSDGSIRIAGDSLPVSRSRKKAFLEALVAYRGMA